MKLPELIRWLVSRQIAYGGGNEVEAEEEEEEEEEPQNSMPSRMCGWTAEVEAGSHQASTADAHVASTLASLTLSDSLFVGFSGRCNKRVDTCYSFWVSASLDVGF